MSEVKDRLKEATKECLDKYEAWDSNKKDSSLREQLQETIHELRKVASRVEIDIAVSERDNMSDKPLPIPPHRSQSKAKGTVESILPDNGNTNGNAKGAEKKNNNRRPRTKRPPVKKQEG